MEKSNGKNRNVNELLKCIITDITELNKLIFMGAKMFKYKICILQVLLIKNINIMVNRKIGEQNKLT